MIASVTPLHPEPPPADDEGGHHAPAACVAAGITYRELDYWDRTGLVSPSLRGRSGSGNPPRLYSLRDVVLLRVVRALLEVGVSLVQIRLLLARLAEETDLGDLMPVTLVSAGATVHVVVAGVDAEETLRRYLSEGAWFGVTLAGIVAEVERALDKTYGVGAT